MKYGEQIMSGPLAMRGGNYKLHKGGTSRHENLFMNLISWPFWLCQTRHTVWNLISVFAAPTASHQTAYPRSPRVNSPFLFDDVHARMTSVQIRTLVECQSPTKRCYGTLLDAKSRGVRPEAYHAT